jgi:N-ethylmaleimide reductase
MTPTENDQPLLQPYRLGSLDLRNRIVMAPMTRSRAENHGLVPPPYAADYYAQRASAGLLVTEGTYISPRAVGYVNVPGIWSDPQVDAWSQVTSAVHDADGRIFMQLWHVGAMSHPDLLDGLPPLAPSAINPMDKVFTSAGLAATQQPNEMSVDEIRGVVAEFRHAAAQAIRAGFDGVELHGANGYLFHQFFARSMNTRTDAYGGSVRNRARFLFEVLEEVAREVDLERVGVRLNPVLHGSSGILVDGETMELFEHIATRLASMRIAYLHLMEPFNTLEGLPLPPMTSVAAHFRKLYPGTIISATDHTRESGNRFVAEGTADLVAFGRAFIANPDLVQRFRTGADLNVPDRATFYTGGPLGYVDYPRMTEAYGGATVPLEQRVGDTYGRARAAVKSGS